MIEIEKSSPKRRGRPPKVKAPSSPAVEGEEGEDPEIVDERPRVPKAKVKVKTKPKVAISLRPLLDLPYPGEDPNRPTVGAAVALAPLDLADQISGLFSEQSMGEFYSPVMIGVIRSIFDQWVTALDIELPAGWALLICYLVTLTMAATFWFATMRSDKKAKNGNSHGKQRDDSGQDSASGAPRGADNTSVRPA